MKTGFTEHLLTGFAAAAASSLALERALGMGLSELLPIAAVIIAGALLPDIDSGSSKPRKYFRILLFAALAAASFALYGELSAIHPLAPVIVPFAGFALAELLMPGHRGFLHSPPAAAAFAGIAFLATGSFGTAGAVLIGYSTHLATDFIGDRI